MAHERRRAGLRALWQRLRVRLRRPDPRAHRADRAAARAQYDYGQVLGYSYDFYNAERLGAVAANSTAPWRGPALLYERGPAALGFGPSLAGGWETGGQAGALKLTLPTAFTVAMLAWGLLEFPEARAAPAHPSAVGDCATNWVAWRLSLHCAELLGHLLPVRYAGGDEAAQSCRACDGAWPPAADRARGAAGLCAGGADRARAG